ncbi:hypothetical protein RI129_010806 [Pyrocoelia pectoralis]|uniref:Uncharacterized protein n=1 Tax=Pyrocoelia pectoralis TaxID=417401 RepID=A0AAN7Z961_9COLE
MFKLLFWLVCLTQSVFSQSPTPAISSTYQVPNANNGQLITQSPSINESLPVNTWTTSNTDVVTESDLVHIIDTSRQNQTSSDQNVVGAEGEEGHTHFPQSYNELVGYVKSMGYTGTMIVVTLSCLLVLMGCILLSYICWKIRVCRETRNRYNRRPKYVSASGDKYVYDKLIHEPDAEDI